VLSGFQRLDLIDDMALLILNQGITTPQNGMWTEEIQGLGQVVQVLVFYSEMVLGGQLPALGRIIQMLSQHQWELPIQHLPALMKVGQLPLLQQHLLTWVYQPLCLLFQMMSLCFPVTSLSLFPA
jgi:hypothetical protein